MTTKQLWWLLPLACLGACTNGANHEKYAAAADSAATTSAAAPAQQSLSLNSADRKIIHTADMTCKVINVMNAVNTLEHTVTAAGGAVEESRLSNAVTDNKTVYYKPDSLKQVQTYTTTATLTLRIPVAAFDSIVRSIPGMVSFIDSRTLKRTDVTATYMGNNATIHTGTKVYSKQKAVQLARKPEDLIKVQEYEDENSRNFIDHKVAQMELQDAIDYATFTIALTQPQQVFSQVIVNPDYMSTVPFGTRAMLALSNGWDVFKEITIAIFNIWPFLLSLALIVPLYKAIRRRFFPSVTRQAQ